MQVTEISLTDWRNFRALNVKLDAAVNVFLGLNAQGKTNLLEAINFASLCRSRAAKDAELVRWGQSRAFLRIKFFSRDIGHDLAIELSSTKRRRILLDANALKPRELVGRLSSVLFSPEDLFMFKGAPAVRRKFLDAQISQASPVYLAALMRYNRLVDQRNSLLKKIRDGLARADELDLWDEQLAACAEKILVKRLDAVDKLNFLANRIQRAISSNRENLSVVYKMHRLDASTVNAENFFATLRTRRLADIKRGSTSVGAHLDDLNFFVNGHELKLFGSQGQLRTVALALKLSELQFIKSETGEYPLLLLDDVMSELDATRREMLLEFLRREKIQTLITATDRAYFPPQSFGKFFFVTAGTLAD